MDLLILLCAHPALQNFTLAGGTSLALRFGHRLSVDLDFFNVEPFDHDSLAHSLQKDFTWDERRRLTTGITAFISDVKVDFVKYPYPKLHPDDITENVRLMSLPDVSAMKLSAITNRGAKKDFYDLHHLIAKLGLSTIIANYQAKYIHTDPLMLLRSLTYFADAEDDEDPVSLVDLTWDTVKKDISKAVKKFL
ncbi:nucleotidyl transferase AbiEii/AbiGii toxin family protein [Phragmitibacter flavus]|uniref:nucleotidyl transferase AbiEii/AbiGii toxin family protein n=1 Tax=Phragmitibacter flavus TaxID=2576071 RepID=UPI00140E3A8F|nr:nucleotidyl transferase AbiEii/AbiGii toxin family protein [Phragmitibacter flavus]